MKKGLMVLFMVVVLTVAYSQVKITVVNLAPETKFYPECPAQPDAGVGAYSLPAFPVPCYWVRYWNASGRVWDKEKGDQGWDGIMWDGNFIFNPNVSQDGRVYFIGPRGEQFFCSYQVVQDPRLTNWWWSFICDKHPNLWVAVEKAALTQEFPGITKSIIDHMVETGFVYREKFGSMTSEQITRALVEYTRVAVTHIFQETLKVTDGGLTEEKFRSLQPGDRIQEFYWYRYGPYPTPTNRIYTVLRKEGETVVVKDNRGDETKLPLPKGEMWKFIKVVPH